MLEVEKEEAVESVEHRGTRKPDKYIDSAPANIALGLIEKTPKGRRFKHKSFESIGKTILVEGRRKDKKAIKDAKLYAYVVARELVEAFESASKENGKKSMKGLVKTILPEIKHPVWASFYQRVGKDFGKLTPQEFIDSVLKRLFKDKKETKKLEALAEEKEERDRLKPSDIAPLDELTLSNRLTMKTILQRVENLLDEDKFKQVLVETGHTDSNTLVEKLNENRIKIAKERGHTSATEEERKHSAFQIQEAIYIMSSDRRGWHKLDKNFTGFRFLFSLIGKMEKDRECAQKLISALFPRSLVKTDASRGFLVLGIETE